jgi:hypothetical protein
MNATLSFNFNLSNDHFFQLVVATTAFTAIHLIIKHFSLVPPQVAYTAIGAVTIVAISAFHSQRAKRTNRPPPSDIYIDDFINHRPPPANRRHNLPAHPHQPPRRHNNNNRRHNNNINNPNNANIVD